MSDTVIYAALLWKPDKKGGDYGASFPDFPGCVRAGKTPEEALHMAKEALIFHIEGMLEDGEDIPEPTPFADVLESPEENAGKGCALTMMRIPKPRKSVRFNIHASAAELARIDQAAESLGKARSRFLIESALERVDRL